jgi:hypothetical protein
MSPTPAHAGMTAPQRRPAAGSQYSFRSLHRQHGLPYSRTGLVGGTPSPVRSAADAGRPT